MDLWGHNPFDGRFPNLADEPIGRFRGFNDIDTFYREIRAYYRQGHRKVPRLWLSEWTVISDKASRIFLQFHVTAPEQARWLRAAFASPAAPPTSPAWAGSPSSTSPPLPAAPTGA